MTRAAPAYRLVRPQPITVSAPSLDDAQRRVVQHPGGPLLVLAGPGTGKTTTLVEAAVARIEAGVPVEQILMLTFSRRAAGELRDRVTARLGRTIREPIARTVHSYAFGVLRMAAVVQDLPAPRLLSAPEQDVIMRQLVEGSPSDRWPASLRPALQTRAFAGELRDLLMRAVERGLDGPQLAVLGERHGRADWIAAGTFLTEYQQVTALSQPGGYDPAELIRSAVNVLLDDHRLLASERSLRRHVFVDEYQDTDPAQAQLLALLGHGADELILVGDPDQAIYAFRGADESAIRDVDTRFGQGARVPIVALTCSRRSGPALLAATRRIADRLPGRAEQRRIVAADGLLPGHAEVHVLRSASEEAAYVAGVLRRAHLDGMPWSKMAVLVRSTAQVLGTLRRAMITAGVPVAVRGEDVPLGEQPAVAMLLDVLACVLHADALTEDVAERLLLGSIGGGDAVYLRRLRRVLRQLADPLAESTLPVPALLDVAAAAMLPEHVRWPVARVAGALSAGHEAVQRNGSAEDVLWAIWTATGLARRWEAASWAGGSSGAAADRDLDAVVELFAAAARFVDRLPRSSAAAFAEHLSAQQIPGDAMAVEALAPEAVAVLTAHASKGLEWDLVCVANVQEGSWPDFRRRGSLLGSEYLVDLLAGRVVAGSSTASRRSARRIRPWVPSSPTEGASSDEVPTRSTSFPRWPTWCRSMWPAGVPPWWHGGSSTPGCCPIRSSSSAWRTSTSSVAPGRPDGRFSWTAERLAPSPTSRQTTAVTGRSVTTDPTTRPRPGVPTTTRGTPSSWRVATVDPVGMPGTWPTRRGTCRPPGPLLSVGPSSTACGTAPGADWASVPVTGGQPESTCRLTRAPTDPASAVGRLRCRAGSVRSPPPSTWRWGTSRGPAGGWPTARRPGGVATSRTTPRPPAGW